MSDIHKAIAAGLVEELKLHSPHGALIKSEHSTYTAHAVILVTHLSNLRIMLWSDSITVYHNFTIPDDWPYRKEMARTRSFRFYYEDPTLVDKICELAEQVGTDPATKTKTWKDRRPPSPRTREKRRLELIRRCTERGIRIPRSATLSDIAGVIWRTFGSDSPAHLEDRNQLPISS